MGGLVLALLLSVSPVTATGAGSGLSPTAHSAGGLVARVTVGNGVRAGATLCHGVSRQVVSWSRREGRGRDRANVVAIRRMRLVVNRLRRSPANGVLLRCLGRARLSNGLKAPVAFGMTAVDGAWYLFLRRVRP